MSANVRSCRGEKQITRHSPAPVSTWNNSSGDVATIPSLGYVFHCGIAIRGSDPYRPDELGPVWDLFCRERFQAAIHSEFSLADAALAQDTLDGPGVFGKILLRP